VPAFLDERRGRPRSTTPQAAIFIEDVVEADGGKARATCYCKYGDKKPKEDKSGFASCYYGSSSSSGSDEDKKKKPAAARTSTPRRAPRKCRYPRSTRAEKKPYRHFLDARRERTISALPPRARRAA